MQSSEFENSQEEIKPESELRIEVVGGTAGMPERRVVFPPRSVLRARGEPLVIDDRPGVQVRSEEVVTSTQPRSFAPSASPDRRTYPSFAKPAVQTEVVVRLSLQFARETCPSDAIVHRHLQERQAAVSAEFMRDGKLWVPQHSAQDILKAVKCFKFRRQVSDALVRLEEDGKIETESTGKYLEGHQWKNNKRDFATWHHVYAPSSDEGILTFHAGDALRYGIPKAMILGAYHNRETDRFDTQGHAYKKMSATELAKELPFDEQTIGVHLRKLVKDEVFIAHLTSAKCVRLSA